MGNHSEEGNQSKSGKQSPLPTQDLNSVQFYPDWAAMQAFYGPRLAVRPYLNSDAGSPPTAPYMWAPAQSMIPHYGAPYAAFYTHYSHPGAPMVSAAISTETPGKKASGNTDGGFIKKLKEFDGLTMSIGNGNGYNSEHATDRLSDSGETGGSSDGSNGVKGAKIGTKRSLHDSPRKGDVKAEKTNSPITAAEVGQASEKIVVDMIPPADESPTKKLENMNTALELKDRPLSVKSSPTNVSQQSAPNDTWTQNERELKRERRKQSNRESARRSRLRKQAETEELAIKVQALNSENTTLKSEIDKLLDKSDKLKLENAALKEKLKDAQLGQSDCPNLNKMTRLKPVATVNLLARVNNSGTVDRKNEDGDPYETRSPQAKLHQLLDSGPRGDAVAAS